jgi:RNA polymerase sigma factor (sigma-70 family)
MDEDSELVHRLRLRDEKAFVSFGTRYAPIAAHFFSSRGIPRDDALDLAASWVHDTLLKIDKYHERDGVSFSAWVHRLMSHAASDWWRARKHAEFEPLSERIPSPSEQEDSAVPMELEQSIAIQEALIQISDRERDIVDLRVAGCGFAEIGQTVNVPEGTARVTYHRALRKLQHILEKDPRISSRKISA